VAVAADEQVFLMDGNSLAYRAFFACPGLRVTASVTATSPRRSLRRPTSQAEAAHELEHAVA
jgi:5'-3' exonuclease